MQENLDLGPGDVIHPGNPPRMMLGPDIFIERFEAIEVATLSEYLVSVGSGKQDFSAEGIEHIAMILGIGVCGQEVSENEKGWTITATAECVIDGRQSVATTFEPFEEYGKENRHALETASRRANRNAMRQLFPVEQMRQKLRKAIQRKAAEKSSISKVQDTCGRSYEANAAVLNMTKADCLQYAEDVWGTDYQNWVLDQWETLLSAFNDPENFKDIIAA